MSIIGEILAEVLVQVVWDKLIRPVLFYIGVGLRLLLNFKRLSLADILKKDNNTGIGFLLLAAVITTLLIIFPL